MKKMEYSKDKMNRLLYCNTHKGYDYYIMNLGIHPTAYILIPEDNVLYKENYHNIYEIDVHYGFTYSDETLQVENETKEGWFLGWDYGHHDDYVDYLRRRRLFTR